jgi:hypothetical protein
MVRFFAILKLSKRFNEKTTPENPSIIRNIWLGNLTSVSKFTVVVDKNNRNIKIASPLR